MINSITQGNNCFSDVIPSDTLRPQIDSQKDIRQLVNWNQDQRNWVRDFFYQLSLDWHKSWGLTTDLVSGDLQDSAFSLEQSLLVKINERQLLPKLNAVCPWQYIVKDTSLSWSYDLLQGEISLNPSKNPLAAINAQIFGEDRVSRLNSNINDGVVSDLSIAAWFDWWSRLKGNLYLSTNCESIPNPFWSGSLQIKIPWCGGVFVIELNVDQLKSLLKIHRQKELAPIRITKKLDKSEKIDLLSALKNQRLLLRVMLADIDLSLIEIQSLSVGDIIPVAHRLDEPMLIETSARQAVCYGWLGQKSGKAAIELVNKI